MGKIKKLSCEFIYFINGKLSFIFLIYPSRTVISILETACYPVKVCVCLWLGAFMDHLWKNLQIDVNIILSIYSLKMLNLILYMERFL